MNGDGKQDFLLTGQSVTGLGFSKLYKNVLLESGVRRLVEDMTVPLPGVYNSSVAWADYDGDGKQDFLLTGFSKNGPIAKLYNNTGSGFKEDTNVSLPGVYDSSVAWADYDKDEKQDFLLTGLSNNGRISKLYKNKGNGFQEDNIVSLPGLTFGSVAWRDYNTDGRQDLLLTGDSDAGLISKVYKNFEIKTVNGFGFTATLEYPSNLPDITLAVSPSEVKEEEEKLLKYTFSRTGDITKKLIVNYEIGGTAGESDYKGTTRGEKTIEFGANEKTVELDIRTNRDEIAEVNETVELILLGGDYTIGTTTAVKGIIRDKKK